VTIQEDFKLAYSCLPPNTVETADIRFLTWVNSGSNAVLKFGYDLPWLVSGEGVNNAPYRCSVGWLLSTFITVPDPDGTPIEFVLTPISILVALTPTWVDCFGAACDCSFIPRL
jgi:hypothetical protein